MTWKGARFYMATDAGPEEVVGWTWRGVGLTQDCRDQWLCLHLGSGHSLARITGDKPKAFLVAEQIATLGDWTFDALDGHVNTDPELVIRLENLWARWEGVGPSRPDPERADDVAVEIARLRA